MEIKKIFPIDLEDIYIHIGYESLSYKKWFKVKPDQEGEVCYHLDDDYVGIRNCRGVVIASSSSEAKEILDKWSIENFPVKEIEEDWFL